MFDGFSDGSWFDGLPTSLGDSGRSPALLSLSLPLLLMLLSVVWCKELEYVVLGREKEGSRNIQLVLCCRRKKGSEKGSEKESFMPGGSHTDLSTCSQTL